MLLVLIFSRIFTRSVLGLCLLLLLMPEALGANILSVCADSSFATCPKTQIYFPCYEQVSGLATIEYRVDLAGLGDLSDSVAGAAVDDMLELWEDAGGLNFSKLGSLPVDVNINNFEDYLEPSSPLGYSPIIFDGTGDIVEEYFGSGSKTNVLGFASAMFFEQNSQTGAVNYIKESHSLYNGFLFKDTNRDDLTGSEAILTEFKTTILHEFGHMIGLDHTQGAFITEWNNDTADLTTFPVMFPIAANPEIELHRDDISALHLCYPTSSRTNATATIRGHFTKSSKNIKSANLIAYNVSNSTEEVVSTASDSDGQAQGYFEIQALVPGDYIIKAERIDAEFSGGSSVGIHDPLSGIFFNPAFYRGDDTQVLSTNDLDEGLASAQRITVSAGSSTNIEFDLNSGLVEDPNASFSLSGRAIESAIVVPFFGSRKLKLKINKIGTGKRRISLSTEYPELIEFIPSSFTIPAKQNSRSITVKVSSYLDFISVFDAFDETGATITIEAEDLDTTYIDNGSVITLL